jgi:hypothetical protein
MRFTAAVGYRFLCDWEEEPCGERMNLKNGFWQDVPPARSGLQCEIKHSEKKIALQKMMRYNKVC